MVICLEQGADLHMVQLMTLSHSVSCFSKIQIGFTLPVPAHLGSPRQRAVKHMCVYVRVCVTFSNVAGHYTQSVQFTDTCKSVVFGMKKKNFKLLVERQQRWRGPDHFNNLSATPHIFCAVFLLKWSVTVIDDLSLTTSVQLIAHHIISFISRLLPWARQNPKTQHSRIQLRMTIVT